jgi:predicted ATPase/class 3 adenylate cyclase
MRFTDLLAQVLEMLRCKRRAWDMALRRRYALAGVTLETPPAEPLQATRLAIDDDGAVSVRSYTPKHLTDTVLADRSALKGEYKHVTVLFADLQDSTALAQTVGPEVLHEVLDGVFALLLAAVHSVEGTINQFTGDGIMALFGAPVAHEDHAARALHAALEIQRAFAAYATNLHRSRGLTLALRLGLHAGPVVVGKIGDDLRMDYTAQGFTIHLANRLQKLAAPGTIYLSEAVRQQAGGSFVFQDLGCVSLRGVQEPVRVYACTGGGQETSRLATSLRRGLSVFLGRERELARLRALWAKACGGQGQVVWLVGEAGVGKSRLVHEFRQTLGTVETLEIQSFPFGRSMPYHAFVPLLRTLLGVAKPLDPEPTRQRLRSQLAALDPTLAENEPLLADVLGLPVDTDQVPHWSPEEQKQRVQHTLLQVIMPPAAEKPRCLLVEDVQWLDSGSHALLELLIASLAPRPVLLLATARPEGGGIERDRAYAHELVLTPLDEDHTDAFVHHWCSPHRASTALKTLIRERTEGNPFFIEEMLRASQEHGLLTLQDGQYVVRRDREAEIPASIQGVLAARIDRLSPDLKEVLQVGAVIGRDFPLWLLEVALGRSELRPKLEALRRSGLIYAKASQSEPTYCFQHALTRDVAYASLLQREKKRLHGSIARALEARYPERLDEHAHHFGAAEHWPLAVQYSRLAAAKAHRLSQCQEAVNLFAQAQRYLSHLPEDRSRQEERFDLHLAMIWPLRNLGQPDAMLRVCREAEATAHALADRVRLGKVYLGYGNSYAYKGAFKPAEAYYQRALQQFAGTQEEGLVAFARYCSAVASQAQGRWKHAEAFLVESIGLVYFNLAWTSLAVGDRAAAERYYQAGQRQTARFMLLQAQCLATAARPDFVQAERVFAHSIQADEATGAAVLVAQTRFYLAQMLARQGALEKARALLTTLHHQFHAWGMPVWQSKCEQALTTLQPTRLRGMYGMLGASVRPLIDVSQEQPLRESKGYMTHFHPRLQ